MTLAITSRRRRWVIVAVVGAVAIVAAVLIARGLRDSSNTAAFFAAFPGVTELPIDAPVGFPAWLSWSHALNAFFLVFIVRSGLLVRSKVRPPAFVTRTAGPKSASRPPQRQSLHVWWHLVVDTLFVLNGVFYLVLLFATGQWVRVVPLGWDVVPNAVSAAVQYLSFDWPVHNGWVHYNALQLLFYFATVFIAGPLALLTGLRLAPGWPAGPRWAGINRVFSEGRARSIHFGVLVYYIGFTVIHVVLIFATGALRNLNHMYAGRDDETWIGAAVWAGTFVLMVVGFLVVTPRLQSWIAQLGNDVRRMPTPPAARK
ncbi:MAG TPA: hypothetical protein VNT53_11405 [Pseudolysinimonas sp.]|nr:hypothetical protein [Pseudolysinimonas sp.]